MKSNLITARISSSAFLLVGLLAGALAITGTSSASAAPSCTIISGPSGATADNTPSFRFTTDATAVTTLCAIDDVGYAPCSPDPAAYTSAPLTDGPHTFYVRAYDAAGDVGSASRSFEVNTAPVLVSINVTTTNPSVTVGGFRQFAAIGTFSDATDQDLTSTCIWSSSVFSVASISNASGSQGLATGLSPGTTQITAQLGSVLGSTMLTVVSSYSAQVQPPINADGTSVYNVKRGVVPVKFTLTLGGVVTCALPPATIAVTRTAGGTPGPINESVYVGSADTGSNFRIDGCQYIYNLTSNTLGVGTYRVDILINAGVVGSATFQLK